MKHIYMTDRLPFKDACVFSITHGPISDSKAAIIHYSKLVRKLSRDLTATSWAFSSPTLSSVADNHQYVSYWGFANKNDAVQLRLALDADIIQRAYIWPHCKFTVHEAITPE